MSGRSDLNEKEWLGLQKLQGKVKCILLECGEVDSHTGLELPAGAAESQLGEMGLEGSPAGSCRPLSLVQGRPAAVSSGVLQLSCAWDRQTPVETELVPDPLEAPGRWRGQQRSR